jgi:hypothetical protein
VFSEKFILVKKMFFWLYILPLLLIFIIKRNIMENTLKRDDFVRLRINSIEKERLLKIEKLTGRKRSDIVREALYRFIKQDYPEFLI